MISKPATLTGKRKRSGPPRGPPVLWWRSWLGTSTSSPVRFTLPTSNGNMPRNGPNNSTFQMQPALFMHSRRCTTRWCPIALRRALPLTAAWLLTDLQPGVRYRGLALQEGPVGTAQAPDYALCLLGTARAQSHFDKAVANRSYQQLLDIWKNADSDFIPLQEAKRELAALK